jgi:molybdate transport system regulatory protein
MNRCFREPLVEARAGGGEGAGARLTPAGEAALRAYRALSQQVGHGVAGEDYLELESAIRSAPLP